MRIQFWSMPWRHCTAARRRSLSKVVSRWVAAARSCRRHTPTAAITAVIQQHQAKGQGQARAYLDVVQSHGIPINSSVKRK